MILMSQTGTRGTFTLADPNAGQDITFALLFIIQIH